MVPTGGIFRRYVNLISSIIQDVVETQEEMIIKAAKMVSERLSSNGVIHIFGMGHSRLVAEEVFCRAGGLVAINLLFDPLMHPHGGVIKAINLEREEGFARRLLNQQVLTKDDLGILISNSGRNITPVEMALEIKKQGLPLIAITNLRQSKISPSLHPCGKRVFEIADIVLDNRCPFGDAGIELEPLGQKIGPTSTLIGILILHGVLVEAVGEMLKKGVYPQILKSINIPEGGVDELKTALKKFSNRIRFYEI